MYNFLTDKTFLIDLSKKIESHDFCFNSQEFSLIIVLYEKLSSKIISEEHKFGYVKIFNSTLIYYFKNDFSFDDFINHFRNLEKNLNKEWACIEFFDKNIKVLEIFKKNSFIRNFRNEVFLEKKGISKISEIIKGMPIDLNNHEYLSFILKYESSRIRLVLHFYEN